MSWVGYASSDPWPPHKGSSLGRDTRALEPPKLHLLRRYKEKYDLVYVSRAPNMNRKGLRV